MNIILMILTTGLFGKNVMLLYLVFFIVLLYQIVRKKIYIRLSKNLVVLFLFLFSYIIMSMINRLTISSFIFIGGIASYYIGEFITHNSKDKENDITKYIISLAIGFFIHAMLNYSINLTSASRNTIDFWTNTKLAATHQGTFLTMYVSLLFYVFVYKKELYLKILYVVGLLFSFLYLFVLGNRTQIVILLIVFLFNLIIYILKDKNNNNKVLDIAKILLCILFIFTLYNKNCFNIKNYLENSNLMQRFEKNDVKSSDENRFLAQYLGFVSIIDNPFGTKEIIGNLNYSHNMWLDVGKNYGIISYSLLTIYSIMTIVSIRSIIKYSSYSNGFKCLLTSIYSGVYLNFLVEPILEGVPFFFIISLLINGMVDECAYSLKKGVKNENIMDS